MSARFLFILGLVCLVISAWCSAFAAKMEVERVHALHLEAQMNLACTKLLVARAEDLLADLMDDHYYISDDEEEEEDNEDEPLAGEHILDDDGDWFESRGVPVDQNATKKELDLEDCHTTCDTYVGMEEEAEAEAEEEEEVVVKQLPAKKQRVRKPKHGAKEEKKKALQEEEVEGGVGDDE